MSKPLKLLIKTIIAVVIITVIAITGVMTVYRLFPVKYYDSINKYCNLYGIDENLVLALIKAESNFSEDALSAAGAKGLLQLTDDTFAFCRRHAGLSEKADISDVDENIHAGVWYLSFLLKKYGGNTENAIAAYNAGFATVDRWLASEKYSSDGKTLTVVPYGETHRHIEKIMKYRKIYVFLY